MKTSQRTGIGVIKKTLVICTSPFAILLGFIILGLAIAWSFLAQRSRHYLTMR